MVDRWGEAPVGQDAVCHSRRALLLPAAAVLLPPLALVVLLLVHMHAEAALLRLAASEHGLQHQREALAGQRARVLPLAGGAGHRLQD